MAAGTAGPLTTPTSPLPSRTPSTLLAPGCSLSVPVETPTRYPSDTTGAAPTITYSEGGDTTSG